MAREKLVWAIDCDDVIVPTAEVVIDAYNERYGTQVRPEDYYRAEAWCAPSSEEMAQRIAELIRVCDIPPTDEAVEALSYLASVDELHMVTGRQSALEETTHRMLDGYLPGVFLSVEHTNFYSTGGNRMSRTKGEVCAALQADVLVDDHIVHCHSVIESGLKEVIVWGDYPWNRTQKLGRGMIRCVAWEEVLSERERILGSGK